jgi:hypothetical protein
MNKAMKDSLDLTQHFEQLHNNPPPPSNPLATPEAKARWQQAIDTVQAEMESVGYETKTREEWATRIKELQSCQ